MKLRLLSALIALLIGGSLLVSAQSTPLPTATPPVSVVIEPDIYVRGGPGQSYIPVGQLMGGEIVIPVSRNEAADWVLIRYNTGYGWIRRDLAYWVENIDALPIIDPNNLTPSPRPGRETATPFFPTETPSGNYINVGPQGAFVRAGPGRSYLRLGTLYSGELIRQPVGRNRDTTWIMFRYNDGFGWIATNSVKWTTDIDRLPVLLEGNLTPSATYTASVTRTSTATPTETATPTASATATPTSTSTATATATITPSATHTDVPTATETSTPSSTSTATPTETATPTASATVTPTSTSTATATATITPSATNTDIPTATQTATASLTHTPAPSLTATSTNTPPPTVTQSPTDAPSVTATITYTPSPDMTLVSMLAATLNAPTAAPTETETPTNTATVTVTDTEQPTLITSTATFTDTQAPTSTLTLTEAPTDTPQSSATNTDTPAPSATSTQTHTPAPTDAATVSPTATLTETVVAVQVVEPTSLPPTPTPETPINDGGGIQPEAVIGGILLLGVLGYIVFYLRGASSAERYAGGFVVEQCPVCNRGNLVVETRQERLLGIPRPRRTVRCSHCRSVLREIGDRRWRYAVDPLQNSALYERYNGREIDEETLKSLNSQTRPVPRPPVTPPSFVDDEEQ